MRRRDLLRFGATIPAALASRRVYGQTSTITRAAVVIGVDRPRDLSPLRAAASGAKKIGDWLESEGINVKRFSDDAKPVKAEDIFDAIDEYISLGTLQQLIVYFAGHGSFVGTGEYWLLSQALHNSNQAVSVTQCSQFSRQCGIPNVVLISDACRSTSASLGIQALTGYNIFPVVNNRKVFTFLDTFFAARLGAPAYEIKDATGKYHGIYTSCFLDAHKNPDDSMIEKIDGVEVIPNKRLETYLLSEVPKRAMIADVLEFPDSSVTSSRFIGRAAINRIRPQTSRLPRPEGWAGNACRGASNTCKGMNTCKGAGFNVCKGHIACKGYAFPLKPIYRLVPSTINDLAEFELNQAGVRISQTSRAKNLSIRTLQDIDKRVGFTTNRELILNARGPNVFKYGTGINVYGTRLRSVASAFMEAQILREGNGSSELAFVQINPRDKRQDSVALEFEDGSGTVIAALQSYVATVIVEKNKVVSVSYEPAKIGEELTVLPSDNENIKHLHALMATAAKFGVFRIDGPPDIRDRNAAQLADAIRIGATLDPALGIYAAYAYADAALLEQIRSMRDMMKREMQVELFDVALLAGAHSGNRGAESQAPFCPMLNQGWQFLAIKNVTLPPKLAEAQSHIVPSLWTTFDREGMRLVKSELQLGRVQ
jgi:hypothetical protein